MNSKQYDRLVEEIKGGPIDKALLFEVVEVDGRQLLFPMTHIKGNIYPAVPRDTGETPGYFEILDGMPITFLEAKQIAILPKKNTLVRHLVRKAYRKIKDLVRKGRK